MSKTLQEERDKWERRCDNDPRKRVVTHFEMKHLNAHVTILVEGVSGVDDRMDLYYDMIRYFKIGDDWVSSCDVKSGTASTVFEKIGEVI